MLGVASTTNLLMCLLCIFAATQLTFALDLCASPSATINASGVYSLNCPPGVLANVTIAEAPSGGSTVPMNVTLVIQTVFSVVDIPAVSSTGGATNALGTIVLNCTAAPCLGPSACGRITVSATMNALDVAFSAPFVIALQNVPYPILHLMAEAVVQQSVHINVNAPVVVSNATAFMVLNATVLTPQGTEISFNNGVAASSLSAVSPGGVAIAATMHGGLVHVKGSFRYEATCNSTSSVDRWGWIQLSNSNRSSSSGSVTPLWSVVFSGSGAIDISDCATAVSVTAALPPSSDGAPFNLSVMVEGSGRLRAEATSFVLRATGVNVSLAMHVDRLHVALLSRSAMVLLEALDRAAPVTLYSSRVELQIASLWLDAASVFFLSALTRSASAIITNTTIALRSTTISAATSVLERGWLIHTSGTLFAVGAGTTVTLDNDVQLFLPFDATVLGTSIVAPLYSSATSSIWDPSARVFARCTNNSNRVTVGVLGSFPFSDGCGLGGVPSSSIVDQCYTTMYACPTNNVAFIIQESGVHVIACPSATVSVALQLSNGTTFVQLQLAAIYLDKLDVMPLPLSLGATTRANVSVVVDADIFSLAADASGSVSSPRHIHVNATVASLAIVIPKSLMIIDEPLGRLLTIVAPPTRFLLVRLGGQAGGSSVVSGFEGVVVYIEGDFPSQVELELLGPVTLLNLLGQTHFIVCNASSAIGIPRATVRIGAVVMRIDSAAPLVTCPATSVVADMVAFYSYVSSSSSSSPSSSSPATGVPMQLQLVMEDTVAVFALGCTAFFTIRNYTLDASSIQINGVNASQGFFAGFIRFEDTRIVSSRVLLLNCDFSVARLLVFDRLTSGSSSVHARDTDFVLSNVRSMGPTNGTSTLFFTNAALDGSSISACLLSVENVRAVAAHDNGWLIAVEHVASFSPRRLSIDNGTIVRLGGSSTAVQAPPHTSPSGGMVEMLSNRTFWDIATARVFIDECDPQVSASLHSVIGSHVPLESIALCLPCGNHTIELSASGTYDFNCTSPNGTVPVYNLVLRPNDRNATSMVLHLYEPFLSLHVTGNAYLVEVVLHQRPVEALPLFWTGPGIGIPSWVNASMDRVHTLRLLLADMETFPIYAYRSTRLVQLTVLVEAVLVELRFGRGSNVSCIDCVGVFGVEGRGRIGELRFSAMPESVLTVRDTNSAGVLLIKFEETGGSAFIQSVTVNASGAGIVTEGLSRVVSLFVPSAALVAVQSTTDVFALGAGSFFVVVDNAGIARWVVHISGTCNLDGTAMLINVFNSNPPSVVMSFVGHFAMTQRITRVLSSSLVRFGGIGALDVAVAPHGSVTIQRGVFLSFSSVDVALSVSMENASMTLVSSTLLDTTGACNRAIVDVVHSTIALSYASSVLNIHRIGESTPFKADVALSSIAIVSLSALVRTEGWLVDPGSSASGNSIHLLEVHAQIEDASALISSVRYLLASGSTALAAINITASSFGITNHSHVLMNVYAHSVLLYVSAFYCDNNSGYAVYGEGAPVRPILGVMRAFALVGTFTAKSFLIKTQGGRLSTDLDVVGCNVQMVDSGLVQFVGASPFPQNSGFVNATVRIGDASMVFLSGTNASVVQVFASGGQLIQLRNASILVEQTTVVVDREVQSWLLRLALASGSVLASGSSVDVASRVAFSGLTLDANFLGGREPSLSRTVTNFVWDAPVVLRGCGNVLLRAAPASTIARLRLNASYLEDVPPSLVDDQCTACLMGAPFVYASSGDFVYDCPDAPLNAILIAPTSSVAMLQVTTLSPFASLRISGFASRVVVVIGGVAPVNGTHAVVTIAPASILELQIIINTTVVVNGTTSFAELSGLPRDALLVRLTRWSNVVCSAITALNGCLLRVGGNGLLFSDHRTTIAFEGNLSFRPNVASTMMLFFFGGDGSMRIDVTWNASVPVRISAFNTLIHVVSVQLFGTLIVEHPQANGTTASSQGPLLVFEPASNFLTFDVTQVDLTLLSSSAHVEVHEAAMLTGQQQSGSANLLLSNGSRWTLVNGGALVSMDDLLSLATIRIDSLSVVLLVNGSDVVSGGQHRNVGITVYDASISIVDRSSFFRSRSSSLSPNVHILRSSIAINNSALLANLKVSLVLDLGDGARIALQGQSAIVQCTSITNTQLRFSQGSVVVNQNSSIVAIPTGGHVTVSRLTLVFDATNLTLGGDGAAVLQVPAVSPPGNVPTDVLVTFQNDSTVSMVLGAALFRGAAGISSSSIGSSSTAFLFLDNFVHPVVSTTAFQWKSGSVWTFFNCSTTAGVVDALGVATSLGAMNPLSVGIQANAARYVPEKRLCQATVSATASNTLTVPLSASASHTSNGTRSVDTSSVSPSCSTSTTATMTPALAPPAPPARTIPLGSVGQSVAVVAGAASPASRGPTIQRAVLALRLLSCDLSIDDPPDVSTSPTQLRVKDDLSGYQRGTVIGNLVLCVVLALLCLGGCAARKFFLKARRRRDVTLWRAAASLQLPGWPVIFFTFLCQPLLSASMCLMYVASSVETTAGDAILGVLGASFVLGGSVSIAWVTVFHFHSARHHRGALVHRVGDRPAPTWSLKFILHALTSGSRVEFPWRDADRVHHPQYTKHFGALFDAYRETRHWFHCVELLFILVSGLVESLATAYVDTMCDEMLVVLCITQVLYAVVVLALRPHESKKEWALSVIIACLGGGFGVLALIPDCPACADAGEVLISGQIYFSFVELCVTVLQLVWSGRAKRFLDHVMVLSSAQRQGKGQDVTNARNTSSSSESESDEMAEAACRAQTLDSPTVVQQVASTLHGNVAARRRAEQQHRLAANRARVAALSRTLRDQQRLVQLATIVGRICAQQRAKQEGRQTSAASREAEWS